MRRSHKRQAVRLSLFVIFAGCIAGMIFLPTEAGFVSRKQLWVPAVIAGPTVVMLDGTISERRNGDIQHFAGRDD